jgi:transcriptional regulator with XRE-family HTH domain
MSVKLSQYELMEIIRTVLEEERYAFNYSQAAMARELGISLSAYKRIINGEVRRVELYTIYRLQQLTGKFMDELCRISSPFYESLPLLRKLTPQQRRFVHSVLQFEVALAESIKADASEEDFVTMIIPTGELYDGMIYDSCNLGKVDIAPYRARYGDRIDCALLVTSSHLQPAYQENDILLINHGPIRNGDTGIFIDGQTGLAYIRKFRQTEPCRLEPITGYGKTFYLDSIEEENRWIKFGYVLTKMRTS